MSNHWRRNEFDHIYSERTNGDPDWNVPMRRKLNAHFLGTLATCILSWLMVLAFVWWRL